MAPTRIEWSNPPQGDDASVPSREQIGAALMRSAGRWAIVGRHDRAARAEAHAERIAAGTEYNGTHFDAVVRRVGNQHLVYAVYASKGE